MLLALFCGRDKESRSLYTSTKQLQDFAILFLMGTRHNKCGIYNTVDQISTRDKFLLIDIRCSWQLIGSWRYSIQYTLEYSIWRDCFYYTICDSKEIFIISKRFGLDSWCKTYSCCYKKGETLLIYAEISIFWLTFDHCIVSFRGDYKAACLYVI